MYKTVDGDGQWAYTIALVMEPEQTTNKRPVAYGVGKGMLIAAQISGYIFASLLVFGGIGYTLTVKTGQTWPLFVCLFAGFLTGNYLVFRAAAGFAKRTR